MVDLTKVHPAILDKFGIDIVNINATGEVIYHCPECINNGKGEDKKGKLYVSNKTLKFLCFRCGYRGSVLKSNKYKGYDITLTPSKSELGMKLESVVNRVPNIEKVGLIYEIPRLYPVPGTNEYAYLINRGFTDNLIKYYDIRMGSSVSNLAHRIIIPNRVYRLDEFTDTTDMYVARYIYDIPLDEEGKEMVQRYLNPYGKNRSKVVFNLHRIKEHTPIIITEGCITAISAGLQAVATYGKLVTDKQIEQILAKKPTKLYINLDPDAYKEALKLCYRIRKKTLEVPLYIVRFNKEDGDIDAADIGRQRYLYYLQHARPYNPMELKLLESRGINHKYLDSFDVLN